VKDFGLRCGADQRTHPESSNRRLKQADACGKQMGRRGVVDVFIDLWPHRRKMKWFRHSLLRLPMNHSMCAAALGAWLVRNVLHP